jgi:lipopolysaccharide export system permease protein
MLFHSSIRKELARSFGATLVVLFTIVLTMLLVRTLGMASKGSVNPEEIMLVLGYTVLGRMPTILTLALFISIVSNLSRLYRDSEMIIWLCSGRSLGGFAAPVLRFSWPVLLVIALSVFFVWPWANQQTDQLRGRFENRGDLERVAPGQFQASLDGRRVFFIDKDTANGSEGRNIFIATVEPDGRETVTSARTGRILTENGQQILMLNNGQRLETSADGKSLRVSEFEQYGTQVGNAVRSGSGANSTKSKPIWELLKTPSPANRAEFGWRLGMALTACNFVLIALATTTGNPRAGRGGNLFFTLFAFVVYYNLLNIGQGWVASGSVSLAAYLFLLHGVVFVLTLLWLLKRHHNLHLRDAIRAVRVIRPASSAATA